MEDALLTQDVGKVLLPHLGASLCCSIESHHGTAPLCGPVLHGAASLLPGPQHSLAHTQGLVHRHRVDWPLGPLGLACLAGRSSSLCLSLGCEFCPQSLFEFAPCPPSTHPCLHTSSWGLPAADILDARQGLSLCFLTAGRAPLLAHLPHGTGLHGKGVWASQWMP